MRQVEYNGLNVTEHETLLARDRILSKIQALARVPRAGPLPGFAYTHVCFALLTIGDAERLGRIQLSRNLGLGEGTTRTIIRHLSNAKVVRTNRQGCSLTAKGATLYRGLRSRLSKAVPIDAKQLALDKTSTAVHVRGGARKVRRGIEQRDAAVKIGATGACTVLVRKGKFVMPMDTEEWGLSKDDPLAIELNILFHPREEDVPVIASAAEENVSNHAAVAASLTLIY